MPCRIQSYLLQGIDALPCEVEIDFNDQVVDTECRAIIVGLPDAAVKESTERVRAAMANSNYFWTKGRTLINLAETNRDGLIFVNAVPPLLLVMVTIWALRRPAR